MEPPGPASRRLRAFLIVGALVVLVSITIGTAVLLFRGDGAPAEDDPFSIPLPKGQAAVVETPHQKAVNEAVRNGAWPYYTGYDAVNDSNTCAGLLALAMEEALRKDKEFAHTPSAALPLKVDLSVLRKKGFVRLSKAVGRDKGPATGGYEGMRAASGTSGAAKPCSKVRRRTGAGPMAMTRPLTPPSRSCS